MPGSTAGVATFSGRTKQGLAMAGARFLNVLQGMAMAWAVVLGIVVLGAPRGTPPHQLLGVQSLRPAAISGDSIMLSDLPLGIRLTSWIGTTSVIVAWTLLLWAAARVSRQIATGDLFVPKAVEAVRFAATGLLAAAVVLPVMWRVSVAQGERWVEEAVADGGAVTLQTSGAPVGTVVGLLLGATVLGVMARAFREGERLRQESDGLV